MVTKLTPSLFPVFDMGTPISAVRKESKERWKLYKNKNFGLEYCKGTTQFCGKYGIPQLKKFTGIVPKKFITLDELSDCGSPNTGILGFSYDSKLDEVANNLEKYVPKLLHYSCVGEFDFSMKIGAPYATIVASAFRSHCIAYHLQECGCPIIPTMKWADSTSFEVCFKGYEKGGAVLISTMGILGDERSHMYFINGFNEMLKQVSPDAIIIYGEVKDWIEKLIPSQLTAYFFSNEHINRMRNYGRKRCV